MRRSIHAIRRVGGVFARPLAWEVWNEPAIRSIVLSEGIMPLTVEEIGPEQYEKAKNDRARFRGVAGAAYSYAQDNGAAAARLITIECSKPRDHWPQHLIDTDYYRFTNDAILMLSRAFKGWRAYRLMKD
jgi:hypothetical protein